VRLALLTRADRPRVGITAIGGLIAPLAMRGPALLLTLGSGNDAVRAPIAPGSMRTSVAARARSNSAKKSP
jgi:hypothetical protein